MNEIKLSLIDYLLVPGAMLSMMMGTDNYRDEHEQSLLDRLRDKIAFARAQPLDIDLGSRFL